VATGGDVLRAACDVKDVLRLEGRRRDQDSVLLDGGVVRVSLRKRLPNVSVTISLGFVLAVFLS